MNDPYQNLANAIIEQAARDYREALQYLKRHPHKPDQEAIKARPELEKVLAKFNEAKKTKAECEQFFQSGYFEILTDLNGPVLMAGIRKMEGYDYDS